jgi:hypothetical protein
VLSGIDIEGVAATEAAVPTVALIGSWWAPAAGPWLCAQPSRWKVIQRSTTSALLFHMRRCAGESDAAPIIDSKYPGGHSKYRNGVSAHSPECVGLRRHAEHRVRTTQTALESGRS